MDSVQDEIVTLARESLEEFAGVDDKVMSRIAEDDIFFVAAEDRIVALTTFDHIGA